MKQKPREEYENAINQIAAQTMHTTEMKTNMMLNVVCDILLDIRELLANPVMEVTDGKITRIHVDRNNTKAS